MNSLSEDVAVETPLRVGSDESTFTKDIETDVPDESTVGVADTEPNVDGTASTENEDPAREQTTDKGDDTHERARSKDKPKVDTLKFILKAKLFKWFRIENQFFFCP